jgi:hypothetical protein
VSKGASLDVTHRGSTVPTVEVLLQLKLSAFTCRTDEAIVSDRLNNATLMHSFTHQTDAIKHGPSMHLPAKAKGQKPPDTIRLSVRHFYSEYCIQTKKDVYVGIDAF